MKDNKITLLDIDKEALLALNAVKSSIEKLRINLFNDIVRLTLGKKV